MPNPLRNKLPDPPPSLQGFDGIVNTRRSKDVGYGGLTVGRNVEITDTKKLVRRNGYQRVASGAYSAVYGTKNEQRLFAVRGGSLLSINDDLSEQVLTTGLVDGLYCWDEDPAGNVYFTNDRGNGGIVRTDDVYLPLSLAVPSIAGVAVVDTAPWTVTPFNLGKTYTLNDVQLFATYVYPDGREGAPSEVVSVTVAPEVKLLRVEVPVEPGCDTCIYATAPGGSRYYLVAKSIAYGFTFPTYFLNRQYTGADYPYTTSIESFPRDASLLCFHGGHLYAASYDVGPRFGVVYCSLPLQYHLFDKARDFTVVAGAPLLLLSCNAGMLIGTDSNIYLWTGEKLEQLADYGVPPGICGDVSQEGTAVFWTLRGVAKAMPYELVTEDRFSADPGVRNHAKILYERGYAKLVASTVSGSPVYNKWSGR